MDSGAVGEGTLAASGRVLSSKQRAPPPPQKVIKCDPVDTEIQEGDIPKTLSATHRKALLKQSRDHAKEPQTLVFKKLDDQDHDQDSGLKVKPATEQKVSLAHDGENLLATFYGMLYTNDSAEKEWKLEVDGFLPICFVQVQGNANKPFRIIAVEKLKRIMEYQVNVDTTCARNSTFVKWQDGVSMFGVRLAKEDQAEQFLNTVKRMASTLNKTALLLKQPERKNIIKQISDPDSTSNIQHTKVSLMIKLPDKQSSAMSVPGLLTMSELFEMICEKENLIPAEHQLSVPRTGARKVTFDSGTAIGSLKVREVAIIRTVMTSESSAGSTEVEDESIEDLLDTGGEENKILQLFLPNGVKKSYRVSLDMTIKQLVMRVCSRVNLNPRHHSLQYIDFKHEFLEAGSTVDEIGVSQVRLVDKRVLKRNSLTVIKTSEADDDSPSNSPHNRKQRKSCSDELESDSSGTSEGDKENKLSWQKKSKSLEVLVDEKHIKAFSQQNGHMTNKDSPKHSVSNGSVPVTERRNSSEGTPIKKPPIPPLPYAKKSANLKQNQPGNMTNGGLRDQNLSPIKKNGITSASTPNLSTISSPSDSPDMKTSTPDTKSKRRAAPPPPPRPAAPKALFTDVKSHTQVDGAGLAAKAKTPPAVASSNVPQAPAVGGLKLKPTHKKRPAPPRPDRPTPPQPAPRLAKKGSQEESKEVNGTGREMEPSVQLKQGKEARSIGCASLSLDLETCPHSVSLDKEAGDDGLRDLRGIPIFVPPPPPDELPPPLDECETPVGPLTDLEADILEGATNDDFPGTLNGYVGMQNIGMFAGRGAVDSQAPTVLKTRQENALESVPEQGYLPDGKDLFPVVPPPPLYSELESTSLTDISPPSLETQAIQTSQESEEKEHDSGFDQTPEHPTVTPPEDISDDVQVGHWEDPDTGSSLDVISAIPPPADFETPPLTPPCQFANPAVVPPEGFLNSVKDDKKEQQPEKTKPRKKLDVSEDLFPWMNEPQAPVNAVIPLDEPKDSDEDMIVRVDTGYTAPVSENRQDLTKTVAQSTSPSVDAPSITKDVYSRPVLHEDEKRVSPELDVKDVMPRTLEVSTEVKPSVELQRSSSVDQIKEPVSLQKPKTTESKEFGGTKIMIAKDAGSQEILDTTVKQLKPETTAKPVGFDKETEVKVESEVDVQQYVLSSLTPSTEAARPEPQVKPVELDVQVKPEKPETKAKPVRVVRETEVKVEQFPSSSVEPPFRPEPLLELAVLVNQVKPDKPERIIIPATVIKEPEIQQPASSETAQPVVEPVKLEQQVTLEKPETTVNPVPFVKEAGVKVDVEPPALLSFNPSTEPPRLDRQVLPQKQENVLRSSVEEAITPQSNPRVEMCAKTLPDEQHDLPVQETPMKIVTVGKQDIVAEAHVTPETRPISLTDDKLKDLEAKLQELDKEPVPSSEVKTLENKTAPLVYKEVEPAMQTKDPFSEEVIVAETKQVEFSSYDHFEKLFKMDTDEQPTKEDTRVRHKEDQNDVMESHRDLPDSSLSHVEQKPELSLDLSSLRQSPEPPRPPSSSPPTVSPRSSSVPSPVALLDSARSTDSGFATLEKPKNPSSLDSKPPQPTSLSNSSDKTAGESNVSITAGVSNDRNDSKPPASQTKEKVDSDSIQTTSIPGRPPVARKPPNVKLQRPLSMPAGILGVFKSNTVQDKSKSAGSDLKESEAHQEKTKLAKSDSRASSSSDSSGISSPSPASSPVQMSTVDMPKPPPFTVPPLRRYSDLAADLSFISSAAKAAEKANESETKVDGPPKPPNVLLRRNTGTAPAERPRSWVGPEAEAKQRPRMWSSAFKPVSFDAQAKKGARPVDFQVKSFAAPPSVPSKPSAPSAVHSTSSVHREAPVTQTLGTKQPATDNSTQKEVEKSLKQAPMVPEQPSVVSAGKSTAPVSLSARDERSSSNQAVKYDSKVQRTPSNPQTKETDSGKTKYEIIYSNTSSTSKSAPKVQSDKTDGGSHISSKYMSNSAALRDQIMRDQSRAQSKVARDRPQSAIVMGSKFQILPANDKSQSKNGMSPPDAKTPVSIQPKGLSWTHTKQQTNDQSITKPDVPPPNPLPKTQPPVKRAVADSKPLPAVVMRTKTAEQSDPTKRHSLPTYIIEGAERKPPVKTAVNKEGNLNFIVEEAQTDTTVVPRGVVAAMKALREKKGISEDNEEGVVMDLEHTQWI